MTQSLLSTFSIVGCLLAVSVSTVIAQEPVHPVSPSPAASVKSADVPARWEYLVVYESELRQEVSELQHKDPAAQASLSTMLSARGHDGWELVSAIVKPTDYSVSARTISSEVVYVFKRPAR